MNMCCLCVLRLNRERISELQQQVEDLQKALQIQGAKPEDVSVFLCHLVVLFLHIFLSVIHDTLLNYLVFDFFLEVVLFIQKSHCLFAFIRSHLKRKLDAYM